MIDAKDRRILAILDENCRASYAGIGKAARLAPETVRYRINRMVENGTIRKFLAIINGTLLGISYYQVLLRLQNVDQGKRQEILSFLAKSPLVNWLAETEGNYDIGFIVSVRNQRELQEFFTGFSTEFSRHIMRKTLSVNLRGEFFERSYLTGAVRRAHEVAYKPASSTVILDEQDRKICLELGRDGRAPLVEIAQRTELSADTVMRRMRSLARDGVILGYTIIPDQDLLGQIHTKILLYLTNTSQERNRLLLASAREDPRVIAIVHTLAEWDCEIDLETESLGQLKDFTMRLTSRFSDIIRDYDALRIARMPKYTFYPG